MTIVTVKPAKFGRGVFAARKFKRHEVIGIVKGRVYDFDIAPESTWTYLIDLHRNNLVVNPWTPFRYLNHCCVPNCRLSSDGYKVKVIATKPIEEGQELTIDYCWGADVAIPCRCGSKKCRGYIIDSNQLHLVRQREGCCAGAKS